jgi:hypothetical protein
MAPLMIKPRISRIYTKSACGAGELVDWEIRSGKAADSNYQPVTAANRGFAAMR